MGATQTKVRRSHSVKVRTSEEPQSTSAKPRAMKKVNCHDVRNMLELESNFSCSSHDRSSVKINPTCCDWENLLSKQDKVTQDRKSKNTSLYSSNLRYLNYIERKGSLYDLSLKSSGNSRPMSILTNNATKRISSAESVERTQMFGRSSSNNSLTECVRSKEVLHKPGSYSEEISHSGGDVLSPKSDHVQRQQTTPTENDIEGGKASTSFNSYSIKQRESPIQMRNSSKNLSCGDAGVQETVNNRKTKPEFLRYSKKNSLTGKPPTPPPKTNAHKLRTPSSTTFNRNASISPTPKTPPTNFRGQVRSRSPSPTIRPHTSIPQSNVYKNSTAHNKWDQPTPESSLHKSPKKPRRTNSISQQSEDDSKNERPPNLSRIEYTFYINDTDECQRPFYDRRVEAIARASSCHVCLHKPPASLKPVYYKGNRVLPVTISARTMITLKRCIARLDMQYPYFNVKAFCPPDMF